jgi:hypothetical protein
MNKYPFGILLCPFVFGGQTAIAGTMPCGSHLIQDDQIHGQSREEIEEKCGAPESSQGDNLYYKKGNVMYRLHFNDGDVLESITEEIE